MEYLVTTVVCLSCFQAAHTSYADPIEVILGRLWKQYDTDENGTLSSSELMDGLVKSFDSDKDGKVSRKELLYTFGEPDPSETVPVYFLFSLFDFNADFLWTMEDVRGALLKMDTNGDGAVDESEFVKRISAAVDKTGTKFRPSYIG